MAAHAIPAGTLLRKEDITLKDVGPGEVHPGNLLRGQVERNFWVRSADAISPKASR